MVYPLLILHVHNAYSACCTVLLFVDGRLCSNGSPKSFPNIVKEENVETLQRRVQLGLTTSIYLVALLSTSDFLSTLLSTCYLFQYFSALLILVSALLRKPAQYRETVTDAAKCGGNSARPSSTATIS